MTHLGRCYGGGHHMGGLQDEMVAVFWTDFDPSEEVALWTYLDPVRGDAS